MFNEMLIREKFMEMVNLVNSLVEYEKENKERLIKVSKEIGVLKNMIKNLKKAK
jgi:hypothetical protein